MKEKNKKTKWKPKKFCKSVTLNSKTGKVIKREFVTAKTSEEEKEWERAIAERMIECYMTP
ncbi:MAG: hypothetical protein C0412_21480 [Flavobacterium sp.]|nr:hypothetical protein [Flavobacterium sp.]